MNSTAKKQNRILLVAMVVILAAAAILIAVTGSANKKSEKTPEPPVENSALTSGIGHVWCAKNRLLVENPVESCGQPTLADSNKLPISHLTASRNGTE